MTNIRVTEKDGRILMVKADLAYETLKRAVETPEPLLIPSAECLYAYDLGAYLSRMTLKATAGITSLRKGGKRAEPIERFILQCLLMHEVHSEYDSEYPLTSLVSDMNDGMGGLRAWLDAKDEPSSQRAEIFRLVQHKSAELRTKSRYDLILKALDYVRGNF